MCEGVDAAVQPRGRAGLRPNVPVKFVAGLPGLATQARHGIEVFVAVEDWQAELESERRDPDIVRRDGSTESLQRRPNLGIRQRGRFGHGQDLELRQVIVEPLFVGAAMPGTSDTVSKFPEHDDRDGDTSLARQPRPDGRLPSMNAESALVSRITGGLPVRRPRTPDR